MRICLLSREYPPESGWGGIATYTYHQAQGLRALGHDVEVIALTADGAPESSTKVMEGVPVHRVLPFDELDQMRMVRSSMPFTHFVLKSILPLARKFFELHHAKPFDVAEAPEHLAEGLGLSLTRTVPFVIRLHTPQSKLIAEGFHNLKASFDQQFVCQLERMALVACDVITSPSEDMARYVSEDITYPLEQIRIVRNPVDSERFTPEGDRALTGTDPIVLFVGRLEERKGIHYLIEAVPEVAKAFPQARFVIIGSDTNNADGQKSVLSELRDLLSETGHAEQVTFIPHVALSEIPNYYRSADICVIPSLYDNAPCTCLESMSTGKPVIASSSGGTPEYVLHDTCGLIVPPRDAHALAKALIDLLSNEQKRKSFGANGRQRVLDNFKHTIIAERSLPEYQAAIDRFREHPPAAIYRKQTFALLEDLTPFLQSFESMLYDSLYLHSIEFRVKHRLKRAMGKLPRHAGPTGMDRK